MLSTVLTVLFIKYYAAVDQDVHKWFEWLHSPSGAACCAETDGVKLDDPNWGRDESGYWVAINGAKVAVPPGAVLYARHPKVNYAVVWILQGKVRCFLPGGET